MPEPVSADGFDGFPAGAQAVPVPAVLLNRLVPRMSDPAELLVSLYAVGAVQRIRRFPRMLDLRALRAERALIDALATMLPDEDVDASFRRGFDAAVARGTLIPLEATDADGRACELLTLNSTSDRRAVARAQSGRLSPDYTLKPAAAPRPSGSIYSVYEDAIGPILPALIDELAEAEGLYPSEWLHDAFQEAAALNKRSWRYVRAILERWMVEGRDDDEAFGRSPGWRRDPRFEHLIQR